MISSLYFLQNDFYNEVMIYICIVEDQNSDLENLTNLLKAWFDKSNQEFTIDSYSSGEEFLSQGNMKYDLYFLDIELDQLTGYELAKKIRDKDEQCLIIFTTNLASYIQKAYSVNALTYLLKPIKMENLSSAMNMAVHTISLHQKKKIIVKAKEGMFSLDLDDVLFIESKGHSILYHTKSNCYEEWSSLSKIEEQIHCYGFSRIKTSLLVNLKYITKVRFDCVELCSVQLPVGRTYRKSFLKDMNQWMNR
jgi:two-component system, LytTR family, response regulator LytT